MPQFRHEVKSCCMQVITFVVQKVVRDSRKETLVHCAVFSLSAELFNFDADAGKEASMVIGYLLVAIVAGLAAFVFALLLGTSFLFAFGLYTLVGTVTLILIPSGRFLVGNLVDHSKASVATNRRNLQNDLARAAYDIDRLTVATEAPMRILAVDDDPFILNLIPMISAKAGFSEITSAASGGEALELLANSETPYDCFLLDVSLPGMNGIELCWRVREIPLYHQTPIVMLTARRDMQNIGEAYRAGATDYVTKPFEIEDLGARLRVAQDMVRTQREAGHVGQGSAPLRQHKPLPSHSIEFLEAMRPSGQNSLIEYSALLSYLTQLPREGTANVRVFAVRIDGFEAVQARYSPAQLVLLIESLAAATVQCLGADRTVMAHLDDGTLLVATNSVNPPPAISIEKHLMWRCSEDGSGKGGIMGVSVGGPVQLQSTKAKRARMAIDSVIALLENRALERRGGQIAVQFDR